MLMFRQVVCAKHAYRSTRYNGLLAIAVNRIQRSIHKLQSAQLSPACFFINAGKAATRIFGHYLLRPKPDLIKRSFTIPNWLLPFPVSEIVMEKPIQCVEMSSPFINYRVSPVPIPTDMYVQPHLPFVVPSKYLAILCNLFLERHNLVCLSVFSKNVVGHCCAH